MLVNREHLLMTNVSECRSLVNGEHSNIHELISSTPETEMRRRVNACMRGVQMQIQKSEQMHLLMSERTNVLTNDSNFLFIFFGQAKKLNKGLKCECYD